MMQNEIDSLKAAQFDYKFFAPLESSSCKKIFKHYGIKNLEVDEPLTILVSDKRYISPKEFFTPLWSKDFKCAAIRELDKSKKCILQCSFIPIDLDGNIPLIKRAAKYHQSCVGLKEESEANKPPKFCFVSFSPIPLNYEDTFSISNCYHREVPDRFKKYKIKELSFIMRRDKNDRVYLFYTFLVSYQCYFRLGKKINWDAINNIFAIDGWNNAPDREDKYFLKDHDSIISVYSVNDIYDTFCRETTDPECINRLKKKNSLETYFPNVDREKSLMPVEREYIKVVHLERSDSKKQ